MKKMNFQINIRPQILLAFTILFSISGCRKNIEKGSYVISGRLLESTSNPIPVINYKLHIYQRADIGYFGGVLGIDKDFFTNQNGDFTFQYTPGENTGFSNGGNNINNLSISSADPDQYPGLYLSWYPISPNKDTALGKVYLYKEIERFVVKIQFNTSLNAGEWLEVVTGNAFKSNYDTIRGPIATGTLVIADTIKQLKIERFSFSEKQYYSSSTLVQPGYQQIFNLVLPPGDELYREQLLIYQK